MQINCRPICDEVAEIRPLEPLDYVAPANDCLMRDDLLRAYAMGAVEGLSTIMESMSTEDVLSLYTITRNMFDAVMDERGCYG